MSKGGRLSGQEQGFILGKRDEGKSIGAIARELQRSPSTVHNFLKDPDHYGTRKHPGRPRKLTDRGIRQVKKAAKQRGMSASRIKSALDLSVTKRIVQRVLQSNPHLKYCKRKKTPRLTETHRDARMNLDGPDSLKYYWYGLREEEESFFSRQNSGGSLMVWAAFSAKGKSRLATLIGRQDSFDYQQTLTTYLLPFGDDVHDGRYIFQRDNASIHASSSIRALLRDLSVTVLGWPAFLPDLNPIENLWGMVTRAIYDGGKQYHSVNELEEAVRAAWEGITPEAISKLVKSMPDRCSDVLMNRGRKTKC